MYNMISHFFTGCTKLKKNDTRNRGVIDLFEKCNEMFLINSAMYRSQLHFN